MPLKRHFIVNAHAGGYSRRRLEDLSALCRRHGDVFAHTLCGSWIEARQAARSALKAGAEQIVALGGDGTVNAVANGFFENGQPIRASAALALSDLGTGADYARGFKSHDWMQTLFEHEARAVDVGVIASPPQAEPRYFLNAATAGISARVVARKAQLSRHVPRMLAYALPTLGVLPSAGQVWQVRVRDESGAARDWPLWCAFIAKGRFIGGGMRVGGGVAIDDGLLDVSLVSGLPLLKALREFGRLFTEGLRPSEGILKFRATSIEIIATPGGRAPLPLECDGELLNAGDCRVSVRPRALRLCVAPPR